MRWITREQFVRMEAERAAAAQEREDATVRAREELGDAFVAALVVLRSRKRIWERLRQAGISSASVWSFAEFNRCVQARGLPATLRQLIDVQNADHVRGWLASAR